MAARSPLMLLVAVVATFLSSTSRGDDIPPSLFIEGYANQTSYAPGEEVVLHVSTSAPNYALNIARIGADTKETLAKTNIRGALHPIPENASSHGSAWPESFRFKIPDDWT